MNRSRGSSDCAFDVPGSHHPGVNSFQKSMVSDSSRLEWLSFITYMIILRSVTPR